jgi:hypothetical protein
LCPREGEKKFSEGGGIILVLEPKYRPLLPALKIFIAGSTAE